MVLPLAILDVVFFERIVAIAAEYVNRLIVPYTLLQHSLIFHIGVPNVGLVEQVDAYG